MSEIHVLEKVIPVDKDGRYVFIISSDNLHDLDKSVQYLQNTVAKWWEDKDNKFLVLGHIGNTEIRLERL